MASVSADPNGRKRILFTDATGARRAIRLGKCDRRTAETIANLIHRLATAKAVGQQIPADLSEWLRGIGPRLRRALAKYGLADAPMDVTLQAWIDRYIETRSEAKPSTKLTWKRARKHLLEFFGPKRRIDDITQAGAKEFRSWLAGRKKLEEATVARTIGHCRQFFIHAVDAKILTAHPFKGQQTDARSNPEKEFFIDRVSTAKLLGACRNAEWRLIIALARYGGLRCPSEPESITVAGVNWEHNRFKVVSTKTEHHRNRGIRWVPIYPELRPYLQARFDELPVGATHLVKHRSGTVARRVLLAIIERAGLKPWHKLWQNLRVSRQNELEETFPTHVVCAWMGNSPRIARKHYLTVRDEHFDKAAQNQAQQAAEMTGNPREPECENPTKPPENPNKSGQNSPIQESDSGRYRARTCDPQRVMLVR